MLSFFILFIGLCATSSIALSNIHKNPHFKPGHDTIVHLFEWKWLDIAHECETFLGPGGFGGIQISPVQENVIIPPRPWWERYQPISFNLTTRSGNRNDLINMVKRCNKAGVRIYVDAVVNHMCADQPFEIIGVGGSIANPQSRNYPNVSFTEADFNKFCSINNYDNVVEVRNCELVGLHDLNQSVENVRKNIVNFMNDLIDIGIAGFRIDAAKHMWPEDLKIIYSRLKNLNVNHGFARNTKPFIYQEVINLGGAISATEYNVLAVVTEFKYGNEISNAFLGKNQLKWLQNFGEAWGFLPTNDAIIFIDNHDTQRDNVVLTHKSSKIYKMAVSFMLAYPYGIPKIMSSFAFDNKDQGPPTDHNENIVSPIILNDGSCGGGWICEHRWRQIKNMVNFRNVVNKTSITEWWDNWNNQIAFSRGNSGFIAINGDTIDMKENIHTQLPPGIYCDIISGNIKNNICTGKTVEVNATGYAYIEILLNDEDGVIAIHKLAKLKKLIRSKL